MNETEISARLAGIDTSLGYIKDALHNLQMENNARRNSIDTIATALREESKTTSGSLSEKIQENKTNIEKSKSEQGTIKWVLLLVTGIFVTGITQEILSVVFTHNNARQEQIKGK